ncbi:hypothetical protein EVJ58_g1539 [Rhodofomes roseus]|uniref:Uncharacterized protein n=1 Tax=Rhodofomes roseus TaxID=34475 RepID=A0A4Y9YZ70_9APHY|nr:hypothetical protein EVJ58_g1539 [Rhodofomes roseus]
MSFYHPYESQFSSCYDFASPSEYGPGACVTDFIPGWDGLYFNPPFPVLEGTELYTSDAAAIPLQTTRAYNGALAAASTSAAHLSLAGTFHPVPPAPSVSFHELLGSLPIAPQVPSQAYLDVKVDTEDNIAVPVATWPQVAASTSSQGATVQEEELVWGEPFRVVKNDIRRRKVCEWQSLLHFEC